MGDVVENDEEELVEDRFDDQSFDDAPLSDPESHCESFYFQLVSDVLLDVCLFQKFD